MKPWQRRVVAWATSLHLRVLLVNAVVLVVPLAGIEFARVYERQLLGSLERDMRNQAILVAGVARRHREAEGTGELRAILTEAARRTRTRIRVLDARGEVQVDSHEGGPPEGLERVAPRWGASAGRARVSGAAEVWPRLPERREVMDAFAGRPSAYTRVRAAEPSVILFVAEPIRHLPRDGEVDDARAIEGVVYVTRSTVPVMEELHRVRASLWRLLLVASGFTLCITVLLTWSLTRPLVRLAAAARALSSGDSVPIPIEGPSESREVGRALDRLVRTLEGRLCYIREFAADVAHEFKTPITSIAGAAELLADARVAASDHDRLLGNVRADAARLDRLVSRLLELSKVDASAEPFTSADLDVLAHAVAQRFDCDETPVRVEGAWGRAEVRVGDVERALINLVDNAVRASPQGEPVRVIGEHEHGRLRIRVVDRGPGIPEAHRPRLFERFFTTHALEGGTGLGLSIAASVARAHGGELTFVPRAVGAEFVLTIRVASSA